MSIINIYIKIYYVSMSISLMFNYISYKVRRIFMFATLLVLLFMFITTKQTFSKIPSSLRGKRFLYSCSLYIIINNYLNKFLKNIFFIFSNYLFSNSYLFIYIFLNFFLNLFRFFFQNFFLKIKNSF